MLNNIFFKYIIVKRSWIKRNHPWPYGNMCFTKKLLLLLLVGIVNIRFRYYKKYNIMGVCESCRVRVLVSYCFYVCSEQSHFFQKDFVQTPFIFYFKRCDIGTHF